MGESQAEVGGRVDISAPRGAPPTCTLSDPGPGNADRTQLGSLAWEIVCDTIKTFLDLGREWVLLFSFVRSRNTE